VAAATRPGASLSAVAEAADAARTGAGEALDRLAGLLSAVEEAGDAARKRIRAAAALGPDATGMLRLWLSGSADTAGADS
jgi:hypothetical protein